MKASIVFSFNSHHPSIRASFKKELNIFFIVSFSNQLPNESRFEALTPSWANDRNKYKKGDLRKTRLNPRFCCVHKTEIKCFFFRRFVCGKYRSQLGLGRVVIRTILIVSLTAKRGIAVIVGLTRSCNRRIRSGRREPDRSRRPPVRGNWAESNWAALGPRSQNRISKVSSSWPLLCVNLTYVCVCYCNFTNFNLL